MQTYMCALPFFFGFYCIEYKNKVRLALKRKKKTVLSLFLLASFPKMSGIVHLVLVFIDIMLIAYSLQVCFFFFFAFGIPLTLVVVFQNKTHNRKKNDCFDGVQPLFVSVLTTQSIGHTVLSFYNVSSRTFIVVLVGTVCCYPAPKLQQKLAVTHSRSPTLIRLFILYRESTESQSHCLSLPLAQVQ